MSYRSQDVKKAFADYLTIPEWDWTWVVTQTFNPRLKHTHYNRKRDRFYGRICEHSWRDFMKFVGRRANAAWGFMFAETHKSGLPHWHALVHVQASLWLEPSDTDAWDYMFRRFGRMSIEPYHPVAVAGVATGIANYLTKYVAKEANGGDATWEFTGFLGGIEADSKQIMAASGVDASRFSLV